MTKAHPSIRGLLNYKTISAIIQFRLKKRDKRTVLTSRLPHEKCDKMAVHLLSRLGKGEGVCLE